MGYYGSNNDGCLAILALPLVVAWYILKFVVAICACALVIPARLIWLIITIPMTVFTGEDHSADWDDGDFMTAMWQLFFPAK